MKNALIIEKPELQSAVNRYGWGLVTFGFWTLYVYLWLPLITLVAWWAGVYLFNIHMVELQGYDELSNKLALYSFVILSISALLIGWANIERLRFQGVKRRKGRPEVTTGQVAQQYNLQESQLIAFRQKKSLEVHFSDKGNITNIIEYVRKQQVVEMVAPPTGLIDPQIVVKPADAQVNDLLGEIKLRVAVGERVSATT